MTLFSLGHTGVDRSQFRAGFECGQRVVEGGTVDFRLQVIEVTSSIRRIHYFIPCRSSFPPLMMVWRLPRDHVALAGSDPLLTFSPHGARADTWPQLDHEDECGSDLEERGGGE